MFEPFRKTQNIRADYESLLKALDALLEKATEQNPPHFFTQRNLYGPQALATLANAAALLNWFLDNINWCGFYLWDGNQLVLGPFQGCRPVLRSNLERESVAQALRGASL